MLVSRVNHDPEELLQSYAAQQAEIQGLRDQLKDILGAALSSSDKQGAS